jgi:hypothetical protein
MLPYLTSTAKFLAKHHHHHQRCHSLLLLLLLLLLLSTFTLCCCTMQLTVTVPLTTELTACQHSSRQHVLLAPLPLCCGSLLPHRSLLLSHSLLLLLLLLLLHHSPLLLHSSAGWLHSCLVEYPGQGFG